MRLNFIDWLIIAAYFALSLVIGLYYARRAGRSTEEFFLSDRSMPWWLAGTSMVATTFAADTPLAVTEMVARNGVAGNWLWWSMLASGMLTVFFFARLWRRAEIIPNLLNWALGVALVYAALFSIGEVIFGLWGRALLFIVMAVVCGSIMFWNLNRTGWASFGAAVEFKVTKATGD
jgi:Na+/proline symporter